MSGARGTGFDLLEAAELRRAGWPRQAVEDYFKAGREPVALRYHLLGKENGARTPDGIGTLIQAFSGRCLVLLMAQKPVRPPFGDGKPYRPARPYRVEDVLPVERGMQTESRKGA